MDAIKLLKKDHKEVNALFAKFEALTERAHKSKRMIADKICMELTAHAMIEEKIFYPAVKRASEGVKDDVLEAFEEHAIVKRLVAEIKAMSEEDERFDAKVTVLMELVRHHVEEEADELFPKVKKLIDAAELESMGEKMEQLKTASLPKTRSNGHAHA